MLNFLLNWGEQVSISISYLVEKVAKGLSRRMASRHTVSTWLRSAGLTASNRNSFAGLRRTFNQFDTNFYWSKDRAHITTDARDLLHKCSFHHTSVFAGSITALPCFATMFPLCAFLLFFVQPINKFSSRNALDSPIKRRRQLIYR